MSELASSAQNLRGVMIQVVGARVLLPNATIAEILTLVEPTPVDAAPDWLRGLISWHGWQVPLVAFSSMLGTGAPNLDLRGQRVLVLKALGGHPRMPYIAILAQGFPRLVQIEPSSIEAVERDDLLPEAPAFAGRFQDDDILVPDLDQLEAQIRDALAQ